MALGDDVEQLEKDQAAMQRTITQLKKRIDALERRVGELEGTHAAPVVAPDDEPAPVAAKPAAAKRAPTPPSKETRKPIENLGFKIFGAVGFCLILLGLFYLYTYAVSQGWISHLGRIVLGVLFSFLVLAVGEAFRRKQYAKYSQLLFGGGLGLLYFTLYAAYAFPAYREALGISRALDTALLAAVVVGAVWLALRSDSRILAGFAFLLGYLAPLLLGLVEPSESIHGAMIAALLLSVGMAVVLWRKGWAMGLYPVIATYALFMILFFAKRVIRYAPEGQTPGVAVAALAYLLVFFVLFNGLSLLLRTKDDASGVQNVAMAVINGSALLLFGLPIVWRYWEPWRGAFLLVLAGAYFAMMYLARVQEQRNLFETYFILAITFITIAIPVQLSRWQIAIAWAVEGLLLVRSGLRVQTRGIRVLGYGALGLSALYTLVWGFTADAGERTFTYLAVIMGLYGTAYLLSREQKLDDAQSIMRAALEIAGSLLLAIMLCVEVLDGQGLFGALSQSARLMLLTLLLCAAGLALFVAGLRARRTSLLICGIGVLALGSLFALSGQASAANGHRLLAYLGAVIALYAAAYLLPSGNESLKGALGIVGTVLLTIMFAVEASDARGLLGGASASVRHVALTILWALEAIALIVAGFMGRSVALRVAGSILFGVTVLKILVLDLGALEPLYRTIVTILVGIIALGAAFMYVKNKERISALLGTQR